MTIDISRETAIPLSEVPRHVPKRRGRKVHYSTVYRWVTKGAKGRLLESIFVGGVRYTTVEAIARFLHVRRVSVGPSPNACADDVGAAIEDALKDDGV